MSPGKSSILPKALATEGTPRNSPYATRMMAGSPSSMPRRRDAANESGEDVAQHKKDIYHRDESGVEVKTTPKGKYTTKKSNDKPTGSVSSGSQYGSFVQHGVESLDDDPFTSVYKPPQRRLAKSPNTDETSTGQRIDPRYQSNWRSGSGNGSGSAYSKSPSTSHRPSNRNSPEALHPQDVLADISNENAQAFLPPGACVFVANLSSMHDDNELHAGLLETFSPYGIPWIKIRRDGKNMPYAFVQYETEKEALNAIAQAKGKLIHGRPCRTERAKAHRTFYICRRDGAVLLIEEGEAALTRHGVAINCSWYPDEQTKLLHNLAGGFFVQLKFWDDGRQAQQAIRNEGIYQFEPTTNIFESPVRSLVVRNPTANERAIQYINQCEQDRNSIFVNNLPEGFTEPDFRMLFNHFGVVVSAVLFQRPSQRHPDQMYLYGFIEYQNPFAARRAIESKNNTSVSGYVLKVAQKNSNRNARVGSNTSLASRHSPQRTPQAVRRIETSPQSFSAPSYPPTPYGWMGFSPPACASPYSSYWSQSPQYIASPYPGPYNGSPSPNPNPFYHGYGYPVDMYGSYYGYPYWASPGTNVETTPTEESLANNMVSGNHIESPVEDRSTDAL